MKIIRFSITGNKRLLLANIEKISGTFTEDCQIIIGTNGAGKSTIFRELTLLPPNTEDYVSGGGKVIVAEHQGVVYTAASVVEGKSWKHSLIKHGDIDEELNTGHTKAVQAQLVESLFGLTDDLFDIFVGDTKFTQMSPAKRREWILRLSGSDLEYAMAIFKDFSKKQREAAALVDHYNKRLATELESQLSDKQIQLLAEDSKELTTHINSLMRSIKGVDSTSEKAANELFNALDEFWDIKSQVNELLDGLEIPDIAIELQNPEALIDHVGTLNGQVEVIDAKIGVHKEQAETLQSFLETMASNNATDLTDLAAKLELLKLKHAQLNDGLTYRVEYTADPKVQMDRLGAIRMLLTDLFGQLPDNTSNLYSEPRLNELKGKLERLKINISKAQNSLSKIDHEIYHLESTHDVKCVECNHVWKPGVSDERLAELKMSHENVKGSIDEMIAQEEALYLEIQDQNLFFDIRGKILRHIDNSTVLNDLWNIMHDETKPFNGDALRAVDVINRYYYDLVSVNDMTALSDKIESSEQMIKMAEGLTKDGGVSTDQLEVIDKKIAVLLTERNEMIKNLAIISSFLDDYYGVQEGMTHLIEQSAHIKRLYLKWAESLSDEALEMDLKEHQIILSNVEASLRKSDMTMVLINELNTQKVEAMANHKILTTTVNELSPADGLIAKHIRGFISNFVDKINDTIEAIWTYGMKVIPSGVDGDAIDCKFPVQVEKSNATKVGRVESPDIAKTSTAQTDIINFGFRIAVMAASNFRDHPIYLDEVGVQMDEAHRERFNMHLVKLLENRQCSQMFIISHHIAMHGLFSNAEIAVLDQSNILNLPEDFNRHIQIA